MGMLGNGDMDDSWLEGNANGREDVLMEVLEKVKQMKDSKWDTKDESMYQVGKENGWEFFGHRLEQWLTKQLKSEGS